MTSLISLADSTASASVVLAQLSPTSGTAARDIALGIVGTLTMIMLAVRAFAAFAEERYGKVFTILLAAIPVFGFAYFPEATANIIKGLFTSSTAS
jgi:hypothetical protein